MQTALLTSALLLQAVIRRTEVENEDRVEIEGAEKDFELLNVSRVSVPDSDHDVFGPPSALLSSGLALAGLKPALPLTKRPEPTHPSPEPARRPPTRPLPWKCLKMTRPLPQARFRKLALLTSVVAIERRSHLDQR